MCLYELYSALLTKISHFQLTAPVHYKTNSTYGTRQGEASRQLRDGFFHRWESVRDAKLDLVTVPFTNCVVQAALLNDHQILEDICQFREGHLLKREKKDKLILQNFEKNW